MPSPRGQAFVDSLLKAEAELVPGCSTRLQVLKLETALLGDNTIVVLRQAARDFWDEVARLALLGTNVAAIGSPGSGKSSTMPYLVLQLFSAGRPVVVLIRGEKVDGTYYDFRPTIDGQYEVWEYPENLVEEGIIANLGDKNAVLVIEPFEVRRAPDRWVEATTLLVASASSDGFIKTGPGRHGGVERFFPLPTKEEMDLSRPYLAPQLSDDQFKKNFTTFGRITRHGVALDQTELCAKQSQGLDRLTGEQALDIIERGAGTIDTASAGAPSSFVVAYDSVYPFTFFERRTLLVSEVVEQRVWEKHLGILWSQVSTASTSVARYQFEKYCRAQLLTEIKYCCRLAVRLNHPDRRKTNYFSHEAKWELREVADPLVAVQEGEPGILFFSSNERAEFVDAVAKLADGSYVGFNFALGLSHKCKAEGSAAFAALGTKERPFHMYYVVPDGFYARFETSPVEPDIAGMVVSILSMPRPGRRDQGV
jgi:hypothetical protein